MSNRTNLLLLAPAFLSGAVGVRSIAAQDAAPASASVPASAPVTAPTPAPAAAATGSADEGRWLAANLPKVAAGQVLIETAARIGGTDVSIGRTRVQRAKLDGCTLVIDRVTEVEGEDAERAMYRIHQEVPLGRVDSRSVAVQQRPPAGPSGSGLKSQPWRVVLFLRDGSIRTDVDVSGRRSSSNDTSLDLIVADEKRGLEVAQHVQAAVQACQ